MPDPKFNIGDKVTPIWPHPPGGPSYDNTKAFNQGEVYTVKSISRAGLIVLDHDNAGHDNPAWDPIRFQLASQAPVVPTIFKVGDKVRFKDPPLPEYPLPTGAKGRTFTVVNPCSTLCNVVIDPPINDKIPKMGWNPLRFEKVTINQPFKVGDKVRRKPLSQTGVWRDEDGVFTIIRITPHGYLTFDRKPRYGLEYAPDADHWCPQHFEIVSPSESLPVENQQLLNQPMAPEPSERPDNSMYPAHITVWSREKHDDNGKVTDPAVIHINETRLISSAPTAKSDIIKELVTKDPAIDLSNVLWSTHAVDAKTLL